MTELRQWSRDNWNKIDPLIRKDCVDHLDGWISPTDIHQLIKHGYDFPHFHHFGGMALRNRLRDVLTDGELPEVTIGSDGKPYGPWRNWDDYYTGALDELLDRYRPQP